MEWKLTDQLTSDSPGQLLVPSDRKGRSILANVMPFKLTCEDCGPSPSELEK